MTFERMSGLFGSFSMLPSTGETRGTTRGSSSFDSSNNPPQLRRNASAASDLSSASSQSVSTNSGYTLELHVERLFSTYSFVFIVNQSVNLSLILL